MRRFLICGGVLGKPKALECFKRVLDEGHKPDGILFAGGILDSARHFEAGSEPRRLSHEPRRLSHEDGQFLESFFSTIGELGIFTALIPGPQDKPLEELLYIGMNAEIKFPTLHLVHATMVQGRGVAIAGMGGLLCEETATGHACSRTFAAYHLRPLLTAHQSLRIMMLAVPPPGPLGAEEGNKVAGDLIDTFHPKLCVVGGPNEHNGIQRIARTVIVNPGHLASGSAAWVDWTRPAEDQVQFLNLREHQAAVADVGGEG